MNRPQRGPGTVPPKWPQAVIDPVRGMRGGETRRTGPAVAHDIQVQRAISGQAK